MRMRTQRPRPTRRGFLGGAALAGGFVLGGYVGWPGTALGDGEAPDPNVFLKLDRDNTLTVISKHLEMGQGIVTGLATLAAEELGADWSRVRFDFAPADAALYNNLLFGTLMGTGASTSIAESWTQMRRVGAAARRMFVLAAARVWQVPARDIAVENGILRHRHSGRQAPLGDFADAAMRLPVPAAVTLKTPREWTLIGTSLPRLDAAAKLTGRAIYAGDIRQPGMLTAVVRRPDRFGARLVSVDAAAAKAIPGVVEIVPVPSGVAVLASDTWAALQGRAALKTVWDDQKAETRSTEAIFAEYRRMTDGPGLSALRRGDAAEKLKHAATTLDIEFAFPYLAHAPMEPMSGVIALTPEGADIWSGSQMQSIDQYVASAVLGLAPSQVAIHTQLCGGSFGRRGSLVADWTAELAAVAKASTRKAPIRLIWTREDDIKGGFYRPMALHRVRAGIDAAGHIAGWQHKIVTQSIFAGTAMASMTIQDGIDASSVEGIVDTPYALPDMAVDAYDALSPVPVLWWRSAGHSHTAHVMETVVDELAHLAGADPVAFRLKLLKGKRRDAAVVTLAAEKAGWGRPMPAGQGRGIAYHVACGTRVAFVAEVTAGRGSLKVDRIVAAIDCGVAVNPNIVADQIEGAIGFALSSVLRNRVTLKDGRVEQSDFDDYAPTRMAEMPRVEVYIVSSTAPPTGIADPGVPPLAPAIGNALFAATGSRLHSLPFDLSHIV